MSNSPLNSELLDQLILLVEQRIRCKDEQLDTRLLIETLKDVFPDNHDDVEATVESFLGRGISITRIPDRVIYQASYEARKYLGEREGDWFIFPGNMNSLEIKLSFFSDKELDKYKLSRKSNSRVDDKCQAEKGFVIGRTRLFKPHEALLEAKYLYTSIEGKAPILFSILHQDGMDIGKYLAQCMTKVWPSYEFEVRLTF